MWSAILGVLLAATVQGPSSSLPDSIYYLPVRVHLVYSSHSTALNTDRTAADVAQLLSTANSAWRAAGIEWTLESIRMDTALLVPAYDSVLRRERPGPWVVLLAPFPTHDLLLTGWNLYLVGDGGGVFGGFFRTELRGVVLAQRGFGIELTSGGRGGATLAHELGHSLGLTHQPCGVRRDIMAVGCWDPSQPSTLTPDQIVQARRQAALGRPIEHDIE